MAEVEIDGQVYLCNKLPTRTQLHVVKRLMPVLQGLAPILLYAYRATKGEAPMFNAADNGADADNNEAGNGADPLNTMLNGDGMLNPSGVIDLLRQPEMIVESMRALSQTINLMPDADADFVIDAALNSVRWKQGDRWVALRASGGGLSLGAADDLATQLRLTWEVLLESLGNFSPARVLPFLNGETLTAGTA
jgi:hypothetical protein